MKLVSLAQARAHLRSDTSDDDADLELKIEAASQMVVDYLKGYANGFLDSNGDVQADSNGEPIVPKRVQAGVLLVIGFLYRERDGSNEHAVPTEYGFGFLPAGAEAVLHSLRRPTVV